MVDNIRVNGKTRRSKARGLIILVMAVCTKESGGPDTGTARVSWCGMMAPSSRAHGHETNGTRQRGSASRQTAQGDQATGSRVASSTTTTLSRTRRPGRWSTARTSRIEGCKPSTGWRRPETASFLSQYAKIRCWILRAKTAFYGERRIRRGWGGKDLFHFGGGDWERRTLLLRLLACFCYH